MKIGLKKKDKPAAVEKKVKRKSSRGSGDGMAKVKTFFANHIEKLLLATLGATSLLLVYTGFRRESLDTDPEKVRAEVTRAQSSIQSPTWAEVKLTRQPEPDRFDQQATQDTIGIDLAAYAIDRPFHPRLQQQNKRRTDPELLPPIALEVRSGYGALAIKAKGREGSISSMVDANSPDLRSLPADFRNRRGETRLGGIYEGRFFVAISGLVPYKQQFDVFQEAFKGAAEYDLERDVPKYLGLSVERAEVQADGSLATWETLDTLAAMLKDPSTWEGREEELVDPQYLLPGLTMPLPPLVLRDVRNWAGHSTVPILNPDDARRGDVRRTEEEAGPTDENASPSWQDRSTMSREGGERAARSTSAEATAESGSDYNEVAEPLLKVDHGMLRYFDFTAQPGKAYRYRVQAVLEDPNNPVEGTKPSVASCEPDVIVRRQSATEPIRRSPWSEPSGTAVVPTGQVVLASSATAPALMAVGPKSRVRIERRPVDEPTINLLTLSWKQDGPYDVPVAVTTGRGALLNGVVAATEAIDPTAGRVRKLANYNYRTDAMVLDIDGGAALGGDLLSPGYVLVRTSDGRLEFHAEMADLKEYEANVIPPDEDEALRAEERQPDEELGEEPRGERGEGGRRGERREEIRREETRFQEEGPREGPPRRGRGNNNRSNLEGPPRRGNR